MNGLPEGWQPAQNTPEVSLPQGWSAVPMVDGKPLTPGEMRMVDEYGYQDVVTSGASLGLSDEIGAGANALVEGGKALFRGENPIDAIPEAYDRTKSVLNYARDQYGERNPITSTALEIGGGLVTGAGLAKTAAQGATSTARAIGAGAKSGFKTGAVAGAGYADGGDIGDRATGALQGAAVGGVLGGGITAALRGSGPVARVMGNILGIGDPEKKAAQKVGRALQQDGALAPRTNKPETLMDLAGDSTRRLAGAARAVPSPGSSRMTATLEGRVATQGDRLADDVTGFLGKSGDDYASTLEGIITRRSDQAGRVYNRLEAMTASVDGKLASLLERPALKKAMRNAQRTMQNAGVEIGDDLSAVPFRLLDQVKKELDAQIRYGKTPQGGAQTGDVTALKALKAEFIKELDSRFPGYTNARRIFSDETAVADALEEGRKFFRGDAELNKSTFSKLSAAEQDAFRLGAAREIKRVIEETPDGGDAANRLIRSKAMRDRLKVIFPDEESYSGFISAAQRESRFAKTRNEVAGGSPTQPRLAAAEDLASDVLEGAGQGGSSGAVGRVLQRVFARGRGLDSRTASEAADMLSDTNIQGVLERVQRAQQGAGTIAPTVGGASGSISGRLPVVTPEAADKIEPGRVLDLRSEAAPAPVAEKTPFTLAQAFVGKDEKRDAAVIASFIRNMTGKNIDPAKTAWCAAFVNSILAANGVDGTGRLNARSFMDFGTEAKNPKRGDVAVFWRESPESWKGHVGFYAGKVKKNGQEYIRVLGGNQDDGVNEKLYPASQLLGFRRPPSIRA